MISDIQAINSAQVQKDLMEGIQSGLDARPDKPIDSMDPISNDFGVYADPSPMPTPSFDISQDFENKVARVPQTYPMDAPSKLSPGDEVLLGMQNASASIQDKVVTMNNAVQDMYAKTDMPSAVEIFQLQALLQSYQFTQELVTKAVASINQGIQSLFRNQ